MRKRLTVNCVRCSGRRTVEDGKRTVGDGGGRKEDGKRTEGGRWRTVVDGGGWEEVGMWAGIVNFEIC